MVLRKYHPDACGRARGALQQTEGVHIVLHMCSMGQIRLMAMRSTCTAELPGQVAIITAWTQSQQSSFSSSASG